MTNQRRRLLGGIVFAVCLSTLYGVTLAASDDYGVMQAICALYEKGSMEWILFGCFWL